MIALVDVNSFYASCEQVFRPDLKGRPVVVLSNNDGCIIAANKEAKALGIPMWKPAFENDAWLKKHHVTVFSSNYALYGDMSNRVMAVLRTFSPDVEVYSIDEAFLSLSGISGNWHTEGSAIRSRVQQWLGLPVGVGIAPTKSLAKVANHIAKKFHERLDGVHVLDSKEACERALRWLPVGEVWGIGRRHATRLNNMGVRTAYDFVSLPDAWVRKNMSVVGLRLKKELQGESMLALEEVPPAKQVIGTQKSFGKNIADMGLVSEALAYYVAECAEKLRAQVSQAAYVTVLLETNPFRKQDPQYRNSVTLSLTTPTDCTLTLTRYAESGLRQIFRSGYRYKRVGVLLSGIRPNTFSQQGLFENAQTDKRQHLMRAMDAINRTYGKATLRTGAAGFRRHEWKLRQEQRSPRYTTNIHEILTVGEKT